MSFEDGFVVEVSLDGLSFPSVSKSVSVSKSPPPSLPHQLRVFHYGCPMCDLATFVGSSESAVVDVRMMIVFSLYAYGSCIGDDCRVPIFVVIIWPVPSDKRKHEQ